MRILGLAESCFHRRNNRSTVLGQAGIVAVVLHILMKSDFFAILQHSATKIHQKARTSILTKQKQIQHASRT